MEKGTVCAHLCVYRENISPISGCRVSGYAQRVITLSLRTFLLLAYVPAVFLPSSPSPPPPTFPIFSFAGRSPHSIFLMLQRCTPATRAFTPWRVSRDEEIRFAPARKWRNYIRGRVEEEERKSQRRGSNGACETWTRSLAFAENTIRKRFSRKVFFFLSIRRG